MSIMCSHVCGCLHAHVQVCARSRSDVTAQHHMLTSTDMVVIICIGMLGCKRTRGLDSHVQLSSDAAPAPSVVMPAPLTVEHFVQGTKFLL